MSKDPTKDAVTPKVLSRTAAWGRALLALAESNPEQAAMVPDEAWSELRESVDMAGELEVPSAKAMFLSGMIGDQSKEEVLTRHHRTILALHGCSPMVGLCLARKLDDANAPGSTRVVLEMAKGLGLLVPAEPIKASDRGGLLDKDALDRASVDDLKAEVLGYS